MQSLALELPLYQQAVDAKDAAFKPVDKLVTRALNMLKASVDNPAEVKSAVTLANKIRGMSAPKPAPVEGEEPARKISTSQQSSDMVIANLQLFIETLAAHPDYQPNETELTITSLNLLLADLKAKAQAVTETQNRLNIARSNRDSVLYAEGSGLVDTGKGVKTYVKAAFSPDTPNFKPIMSLEFRRVLQ